MSKKSSLFADLEGKDTAELRRMYEEVLQNLSSLEEEIVNLYLKKKIHSETIKYAVNKSDQPPVVGEQESDELISLAIEQKQ